MTQFRHNIHGMKKTQKTVRLAKTLRPAEELGRARAERLARFKVCREGFLLGFSAPMSFFTVNRFHRPDEFEVSVEKAWADVGRVMQDVMDREIVIENGKIPDQTLRKANIAA
jgi:hypothetical protein